MTGNYENDIYTCRLRLVYLIPEYLPIKGKRARIYYHGISPFCIVCNNPGHVKSECDSAPVSWTSYIESLKDTGIPASYFEPAEGFANPNNSTNSIGPSTSTPNHSGTNFRSELQALIAEAISAATGAPNQAQAQNPGQAPNPNQSQNLNNSQNQEPPTPPINPTLRNTRASNSSLGESSRGRGRASTSVNTRANTRSRARGRGIANGGLDPNIARVDQGYGFGNECHFGTPANQRNRQEILYPFNYPGDIPFYYPPPPRGRGRGRGY